MWINWLRNVFNFPSPYEGDHASDPLFSYNARRVKWMSSPERMRKFNREMALGVGIGLFILIPLFVYLTNPPPYNAAEALALMILITLLIWFAGVLADFLCGFFAVNSMQVLKNQDDLELIASTTVNRKHLLTMQYRVALVYTWRVLWVVLVSRFVLVMLWGGVLGALIYVTLSASRVNLTDAAGFITLLGTGYMGGAYLLLREPVWRYYATTAIGIEQAVYHAAYSTAISRLAFALILYWAARFITFSCFVYLTGILALLLWAIVIWISDALIALNLANLSVFVTVSVIMFGVAAVVWLYRSAVLLSWTGKFDITGNDKVKNIRIERMISQSE